MMGRMAHSQPATLLNAHQSPPTHHMSLNCRTWKKIAMGGDELLREKPFLEGPVVCAAFVLQRIVFVSIHFGLSGATLFVDEMSSELGVRDLASRFLFRNVHRGGATSAPNSERDVPWLGRSRSQFCPPLPYVCRLLSMALFVFTGLRIEKQETSERHVTPTNKGWKQAHTGGKRAYRVGSKRSGNTRLNQALEWQLAERRRGEERRAAERVQAGTHSGTQVAKMARMQNMEERVHGRKAWARTEAKERRKVAKVTAEHAGLVAKQPNGEAKVKSMKKQLTVRKNCKLVYWKRANMSNGKK